MTTLADVPIGGFATVASVGGQRAFRRRLMELGILPGTRVELVRVAPLGDPIELRVRGSLLSIRREEAATIAVGVEPESAGKRATADSPPSVGMRLPAAP
jgi:Fe2+ transport system protein FeoA